MTTLLKHWNCAVGTICCAIAFACAGLAPTPPEVLVGVVLDAVGVGFALDVGALVGVADVFGAVVGAVVVVAAVVGTVVGAVVPAGAGLVPSGTPGWNGNVLNVVDALVVAPPGAAEEVGASAVRAASRFTWPAAAPRAATSCAAGSDVEPAAEREPADPSAAL